MNATLHGIGIALVVGGCAVAGDESMNPPPTRIGQPASVQSLLPELLADAARRSGVTVERLRVERIESVTWPDGAMGCPRPGMLYPQVLVPGWRVRIAIAEAGPGPVLDYHLGSRGQWLHCPPGRATAPLPRGADPRI